LKINPNVDVRESQSASQVTSAASSKQAANNAPVASSAPNNSDRANLSADALQLSNLSAAAATVPAIRQERVTALTQSVQNGSFAPSNDQVANSLLRDFRSSALTQQ
jgi:flagellar biosynthesis anti-sigma factor FlgM